MGFIHLPAYRKFECGIPGTLSSSSKVVGGESTEIGEFPWMALLGIVYENDEIGWKCGGSIINNLYILSAAHCDDPDIVRLGEWKVDDKEIDCMVGDGNRICGEKVVLRHPKFK